MLNRLALCTQLHLLSKCLKHFREMNWPPDVQGFPREYFSILSGGMQLVRTWHRLDFMLYYRYKKRETTDGRSHLSQLRNNRFSLVAMGGYFFLLKEMIVKIITVKAVRNIPICVKSLSVMYTASPPFKVLWHFGRWIDRLSSKVSLVNILAYYRGKCNFINSRSQDWVKNQPPFK